MFANKLWNEHPIIKGQISEAGKISFLKTHIREILSHSDWTQLSDSGLTLSEQLEQQELRLAWMELDDPNLDPDTISLPPYPLMERP